MPFSGPIEDRLAIRELMDIYADAVNQRDATLWGSTWTEDSSWKLPVIPGMENVNGKDNIISAWTAGMDMFPFIFMSISVGDIQVNGDAATARSYTSEVGTTLDGTEIRPCGQYDDILVKSDGQWLFKERIFITLYGE
jgi:uncharacterized protein (TIGR02246 family)